MRVAPGDLRPGRRWPGRLLGAHDGWPVRRVAIVHRVGELSVGETSVIVAVSAPRRADAFEE